MSVNQSTFLNTKKDADLALSKKSSVAKEAKALSVKAAILSALISVTAAVILFIAQSKIGIMSDVSDFLVLGKDNITTIQRELGYDRPVGYAYSEKHIREKFGFTKISVHERFQTSCALRKQVHAAGDSIDVCLNLSFKYKLIKTLNTLRGMKILVLERPHRFAWETFINFSLVVVALLFLFSLLFVWFYREVMNVVFYPFYDVYRYLNGCDEANLDVSLVEVNDLYNAIKQRSKVERELAVFKAIATTTQMVAHDVRQPIDMVSKFVRRLATLSGDSLREYAIKSTPSIERATADTYGMLEDLMDISAESQPLQREPVDLEEFLKAIANEFEGEHITVKVAAGEPVPFDASKIKRVIANILRNAFDAAQRPARFWIMAVAGMGYLRLELGNTRSRIPHDQLEHIFDAFYTAGKGSGRGLGMAIARKFVEAHGGEIWCESNGTSIKHETRISSLEDYVIFHIKIPLDRLPPCPTMRNGIRRLPSVAIIDRAGRHAPPQTI